MAAKEIWWLFVSTTLVIAGWYESGWNRYVGAIVISLFIVGAIVRVTRFMKRRNRLKGVNRHA